jgi:tRNA splicing ligase
MERQEKIRQARDSLEQQEWVKELRILESQYREIASPINQEMETHIMEYEQEYAQLVQEIKNRPHTQQTTLINKYLQNNKTEIISLAKVLFKSYMVSNYEEQQNIVNGNFHNAEIENIL